MASSGNLQNCTSCFRRKKVSPALTFCRACNQAYCETCLEYHDNIFGVNNHDMVAIEVIKYAATSSSDDKETPSTAREMCRLHPAEPILLYCFPHDEVFCQVCKTIKHRECIGVEYISWACKGFSLTSEVETKRSDLETTLTKLSKVESTCHQEKHKAEKEMNMLVDSVRQIRQRAIECIDSMERESIDVIKSRYLNITEKLSRDITSCQQQIHTLEHLNQLYNRGSREHEALFIFDKMCHSSLTFGSQTANDIEAGLLHEGLQISIDTSLEDKLKDVKLLNCLEEKVNDDQSPCHPKSVKTEEIQLIKIKTEKDKHTCKITSICKLEDGWLVLTDYENTNVKLFDPGFNFVSEVGVGDWPNKVCQSGPEEISLGMEYLTSGAIIRYRIAIEQGNRQLVKKTKVKMKHYCLGLCYSDGEYFMSDLDGKVHIYNQSCTSHRILYKGDFIKDITFSSDLSTVYIADEMKGLVIVDRLSGDHNVVKANLKKPIGVTADREGGVFVCDQKLRNIFHIDKTGTKISGQLLEFEPERKKPRAIFYDMYTGKMIIAYYSYDFLEYVHLSS